MKLNHLNITWATSRGRDTYGYNICRLDSRQSGKRYRCSGGGYDMVGTVMGEYLQNEHAEALQAVASRAHARFDKTASESKYTSGHGDLYGLCAHYKNGELEKLTIDGACGKESVKRIGEAIGLEWQWLGNKKGHTTGYIVSWEV